MRHVKHIGLVVALLIAGAAAGICGSLIFPFIALTSYGLARFALGLLLYAAVDGLYFHEYSTVEHLKAGNVSIGIFNAALLLACIGVCVWGV